LEMSRRSMGVNQMAGVYDFESTIGKGHFAVVKLARHVFTGEKVAVKVIDKNRLDLPSVMHLFQEVRCMKLVRHPNVVRLYEVIDTQSKLFLILELGDYDLYDFIMCRASAKRIGERQAQRYFSQIVEAIAYCHKLHVVHRDLKPENVVFFEKLDMVKLTDFGFSHLFTPGQMLKTSCGSLAYSAPEILLGNAYDAPAVDIWSLGVILYMLVCGRLPFQEASDSETLTKILDCSFSLPSHLSDDCQKLICSMLVRDPASRATLTEIAKSKWVNNCCNACNHASQPLVLRQNITATIHQQIIEQMVDGGIADETDILQALEEDEYNHLTATYYLLAERNLKNAHPNQACQQQQCNHVCKYQEAELTGGSGKIFSENGDLQQLPEEISETESTFVESTVAFGGMSWRKRNCSTVRERSEDEMSSTTSASLNASRNSSRVSLRNPSPSLLVSRLSLRRSSSLKNLLVGLFRSRSPSPRQSRSSSFTSSVNSSMRTLDRILSSPHLLQIREEDEDYASSANSSKRMLRTAAATLAHRDVHHRVHEDLSTKIYDHNLHHDQYP
ncbi:SNF-related serine/threonine-protein kinase, partial [Trichinella papuae]